MIGKIMTYGLILILIFNVLSDWYFYKYFIRRFTDNKIIRWAHWIIDFIFTAIMAGMFISSTWGIGRIPSQWFVSFMLIYILVYVPKFTYMLYSWPALLSKSRRFKKVFYWIGGITAGLMFIYIFYGESLGPRALRVTEVSVYSENLPQGFDGFKIAHFSDTHLGNMSSDVVLKKALNKIKETSPDIIVFSGDLVHNRTNEAYRFREILNKYPEVTDVYAVLGNHDYGQYVRWQNEEARMQNMADMEVFYDEIGWTLMNNSSVVLTKGADSIALIGVENWGSGRFQKNGDLEKALAGTENIPYRILISHDPSHWREKVMGKEDIDLTLSGHTHGMQFAVNLFGQRYSPASFREKYWGGLYKEEDQYLYVNEGMGVTFFPFRAGAIPELTLITLKTE